MSSNVNNPNWWYKSHTYAITPTLHAYIQAHAIPEEEASYLCFIQNQVIVGCNRAETDDQGYFRVSKNVWQNKCGMHYPKWLDLLVSIGELEIDHSYQHLPEGEDPHNFIPKCKGYRVPYEKIASGLVKVDYKKSRGARPLKPQSVEISSPHLYYLLLCLAEVRVVDEPIFPADPLRYAASKQCLERTRCKAFGLHRASSGRLFHTIIISPRDHRLDNIRHSNGERFVDVDIKTCFPHLMLPLFTDPKEKKAFYADLQKDVYRLITPTADRDAVKKCFAQYVGEKNRNAEWLANTDVHSYFTKNFPIFWKEHLSPTSNKKLAMYLQGVESQIVTRELVQFCMINKYFIITMHDGCLTLERYKDAIMGELKRLLREHTGFAVGVEEKQLGHFDPVVSTADEIAKGQNEPQQTTAFDFASIDTLYEMTDALADFKRHYEPLKKRASQEARRNYSPNQKKQTKRQARIDYILHGPSPKWKVWRECHKAMKTLEQKYSEPIRYFAEKPTIKRRVRI